jgi:hypothetical protein
MQAIDYTCKLDRQAQRKDQFQWLTEELIERYTARIL